MQIKMIKWNLISIVIFNYWLSYKKFSIVIIRKGDLRKSDKMFSVVVQFQQLNQLNWA